MTLIWMRKVPVYSIEYDTQNITDTPAPRHFEKNWEFLGYTGFAFFQRIHHKTVVLKRGALKSTKLFQQFVSFLMKNKI